MQAGTREANKGSRVCLEVSRLTSDVEAAGRLEGRHRHAPQQSETRRQGHLGGFL